jgi:hypothetical protein
MNPGKLIVPGILSAAGTAGIFLLLDNAHNPIDTLTLSGVVVNEPHRVVIPRRPNRPYEVDVYVDIKPDGDWVRNEDIDSAYHGGERKYSRVFLNLEVGRSLPEMHIGDIIAFELTNGFDKTGNTRELYNGGQVPLYRISSKSEGRLIYVTHRHNMNFD